VCVRAVLLTGAALGEVCRCMCVKMCTQYLCQAHTRTNWTKSWRPGFYEAYLSDKFANLESLTALSDRAIARQTSQSSLIDLEDTISIEHACLCNFNSTHLNSDCFTYLSRIRFHSHKCQVSIFFYSNDPYVSVRRISYTSYKRTNIMLMHVHVISHLFLWAKEVVQGFGVSWLGPRRLEWLWIQILESQELISLLLACSCVRPSCARTDTISEVRAIDPHKWGPETARKDKRERTRHREKARVTFEGYEVLSDLCNLLDMYNVFVRLFKCFTMAGSWHTEK